MHLVALWPKAADMGVGPSRLGYTGHQIICSR
jgi:hypothetical protein